MAKVRVYELAKELNIESKALVDKLVAGGLDVKNYMSTLDEETAERAKAILFGTVSEIVEEKRIKPTVIRRRKKTVVVEEERPSPAPEEAIAAGEVQEMPGRPAEPAATFEPVPAAEIEHPAVTPEPPPPESAAEKAIPELEEKESAPETAAEPPVESAVEEPEHLPETELPQVKPLKEKVKKKKKKTERPAKIIKRAEEGPLKGLLEKQQREEVPERAPAPRTVAEAAPPAPGIEGEEQFPKKKKEKRKGEKKKEDAPRSFVRHRKVEVFERADLYEGRVTKRKEKKPSRKVAEIGRRPAQAEAQPKAAKRKIKVSETVTVGDLAKAMGVKATEIIRKLISMGVVANLNQAVDFETASLIADEYGYELELDIFELEDLVGSDEDKPEDLKPRPPVVTIMGHVDHGKTSLLDYIRQSNIIGGESGGITQHIGAYYVKRDSGDVVFLDTPGHEAFTAMRARGAKVTDIIVLVVAADDGVMPQTVEAINHARAADIPMVVAVNKIDKPEANPEKVRRELSEHGLIPEEWGGQTIFGNISAKTGEGVDDLLELLHLQSEILELKANPEKRARGTIIEARLDKNRGPVATVLVKSGTLQPGDFFICGEHYGKIRAMTDHRGRRMKSAGPSVPAEIYGISGVPMAGDELIVVKDEKTAKQVSEHRKTQVKTREAKRGIVSLEDLFQKIKEGEIKELNLVLKTDVQGSLEALTDALNKLSTGEVKIKIIHSSTGAIAESDVILASASNAIIIGFNVRANPRVSEMAKRENVDIRYYDVIYNVVKDMRLAMAGLLEPVFKENVIGRADIKETFRVPRIGAVAGCLVTQGRIERNAKIRLLRDDMVVFDGKISSLKRYKEDVKEVQSGYECGIGLENFQDVKPGDVLEAYLLEEVAAQL